jgi:hypothetical protein
MPTQGNPSGQMLLAEEYLASENPAFLETLRRVNQPKSLAGLADRWKKDPRPWAREQIFAYLTEPMNCPGHQPVIKHLFKHAEETRDNDLMAAFLAAFDRQVRRRIQNKRRWGFSTRSVIEQERLVTPRDVIPLKADRGARNPMTGEAIAYGVRTPANAKLFSYRTRYYLRRRAWRYFRHLGYHDPVTYLQALIPALAAYTDADLERGENILDSWGLMHACFGDHDALEFGATHIKLKEGRGLGDLIPAPVFLDSWKKPEAAPLLLALATQAHSRLIRVWSMQLFQREHLNFSVPLETIVRFLDHEDADVQQFGAKLLESSPALATLPVSAWLKLLETKNEDALQRICDAFAKHVSADRLDLQQCIDVACMRPVPVARLGQNYLKQRVITSSADREQITALANARCAAVAGDLTTWALSNLGTKENYVSDQVIRFFDSTLSEIRIAAWTWLVAESPALHDAAFWSRLVETPYDDLRLRLIDFLQEQTKVPGAEPDKLEFIWRSVLLGVHRGGRQKAKAVQQIAHAILKNPANSDSLLPVLAVAVRSVRGPEARAGLAAVMSLVDASPQLAEAVRKSLPELKIEEVAA